MLHTFEFVIVSPKIIEDITRSEIKWVYHLFSDGRELVGHDAEDVIKLDSFS